MGIAGIYEYDKYAWNHPGHSASEQNAQSTEMFIGLAKQWSRIKGNGSFSMVDKLCEHMDIIGTCSVFNGQVNFRNAIKKVLQSQKLIWEEPQTSRIEAILERTFDPVTKLCVNHLSTYVCGSNKSPLIAKIHSQQTLAAYDLKHQEIIKLMKQEEMKKIEIEENINSEEYRKAEKKLNQRNRNKNKI